MHDLLKKIKSRKAFDVHHPSHFTLHLPIFQKQIKIQLISKFFDSILENSNKSYPSMVAFYLMTLEYSIISQQIIQSFEIVTC